MMYGIEAFTVRFSFRFSQLPNNHPKAQEMIYRYQKIYLHKNRLLKETFQINSIKINLQN